MLHNFVQNTMNYFADQCFIGIVHGIVAISKGLFILLDQVFFGKIGFVLISTFIAVVLNKMALLLLSITQRPWGD